MSKELLEFWKKSGPDPMYGGFYGTLNRKGDRILPSFKSLRQQARHLWVFSTWYRYREPTPEIKSIADNLYNFITKYLYDNSDKEFIFSVNEDGSLKDSRKQLYALSFALFSLSEYSMTFDKKEAADYAIHCFRSIDRRIHDAKYGGYDQSNDPGWLPEGAGKGTNTHMHLVESFTALYEATGDAVVRSRLEELVRVFLEKIIQPENYCHTQFSLDWTPFVKPVVEYGHDLQSAWLLMNAARALGRQSDRSIINGVLAIGLSSSKNGFDTKRGGYYFSGTPAGNIINPIKTWWVQAEVLNGLWWMFSLTGDQVHLDRLEKTLEWITNYQQDPHYGDWYTNVNSNGFREGSDNKGTEWKTGYHNIRALLFVERWIADYLKALN